MRLASYVSAEWASCNLPGIRIDSLDVSRCRNSPRPLRGHLANWQRRHGLLWSAKKQSRPVEPATEFADGVAPTKSVSTHVSSSRSLRGVETVESSRADASKTVEALRLRASLRSGGACQPIIVMERAENRQGNDAESSWNRVPRRSGIDRKVARRLRDIGSQ